MSSSSSAPIEIKAPYSSFWVTIVLAASSLLAGVLVFGGGFVIVLITLLPQFRTRRNLIAVIVAAVLGVLYMLSIVFGIAGADELVQSTTTLD